MDETIVEKKWEHSGLHCEVMIVPAGHRCGYVFIEKEHPFYGVHYSELPEGFKPGVNGGLTYAGKDGDSWVFGFDFAHCWDNQDTALVKTEYHQWRLDHPDPSGRVATLDIAVADCERLAETLDEWKDREFVFDLDEWRYFSERVPDAITCKGVRYEKVNANGTPYVEGE